MTTLDPLRRNKVFLIRFAKSVLLLVCPWLFGMSPQENLEAIQECDKRWPEVSAQFIKADKPRYDEFIAAWKKFEPQCGDSPVYKARLASIYLAAEKPEVADKIMEHVDAMPASYKQLVLGVKLKSRIDALFTQGDEKALIALEPTINNYISEAPEIYTQFLVAAFYYLAIGKLQKAEEYGKHAVALNDKDWYSWRTLAFAYEFDGKYSDALNAGQKAFAMQKSLAKDVAFMTAMSRAYASTGDFGSATRLLAILEDANPGAKGSAVVDATIQFDAKKFKERTEKGN